MNVMIFLMYFFSLFFLSKGKNLIFEYMKILIILKISINGNQFIINQNNATFRYYTYMRFIFKSGDCFKYRINK